MRSPARGIRSDGRSEVTTQEYEAPGWLRLAIASCAASVVALGVLFFSHVRSHGGGDPGRITITDSTGTTWAVLEAGSEGPSLLMMDKAGRVRISLAVINGRPALGMYDQSGHARLTAEISEAGFAQLYLADRNGRYRLQLAEDDSISALSIYDGEGVRQFYAGVEDSTSACISIADPAGFQNMAAGWYGPGFWGPSLTMSGSPGSQAMFQAGCVSVPGEGGWITRPVNTLRLYDASGDLVWSAP